MPWPAPSRWNPAESHEARVRVDIWSKGVYVDSAYEIVDGDVTEKRVTGIRSTLSLTVEDSPQWEDWLSRPSCELYVWSGMGWGATEHLCPLGVFPVLPANRSAPGDGTFRIDADDRWQHVAGARFYQARLASIGHIRDVIAELVTGAGIRWSWPHPLTGTPTRIPRVEASSYAPTPGIIWEPDRSKVIGDLAESIGAEVFYDRAGQAVIRDRAAVRGRDLFDGPGGTVVKIEPSTGSLKDVANTVVITSTGADSIVLASRTIIDPFHPAHPDRIGGVRVYPWSSPDVTDREQAETAIDALLAKVSEPARSWSVECAADATRMAGDLLWVTADAYPEPFAGIVDEVKHPLGRGNQELRLVAV